jgi:pimeloyl-ACP methyl ester carboxylesterase
MFGVVHIPRSGHARAGIVLCPPLGKEHVDTYSGLKLLAQALCDKGFAVLRFDYLGTGDSGAEQGADTAIDDYIASIREATAYLRDGGAQTIGLVGLRIGALMAALAASSLPDVSHVVLWDPVTDGRRFLREQRVLYRMLVGAQAGDGADGGGEPILGIEFSTAAARTLKGLALPAEIDQSTAALILGRPERLDDPRLMALAATANCALVEADGQAEFVEPVSFVVEIPLDAVTAITSWLDAEIPTARRAVTPVIRLRATVATLPDGSTVVEAIDELGPNRLFAIRTAALDLAGDAPTLLIHSMAAQHRVGPGRVWVETARDLAGRGLEVIRYDRRGTGDTGVATAEFAPIYSRTAKEDVHQAIAATGTPPDRLMMTGVCSGAWSSAYGALSGGAKSVVLVNAIVYSLRQIELGLERLIGLTPPEPGDSAPSATKHDVRQFLKNLIRRWLPYALWLQLGHLGLTQVPEVLLKQLRYKTASVDIVLSPDDYAWFETQRGNQGVARLSRPEWSPTVAVAPAGDHALLQRDLQNFVRRYLAKVAERDFGVQSALPTHVRGGTT